MLPSVLLVLQLLSRALLLLQLLQPDSSEASKSSDSGLKLRHYLYFCTSKASNLRKQVI